MGLEEQEGSKCWSRQNMDSKVHLDFSATIRELPTSSDNGKAVKSARASKKKSSSNGLSPLGEIEGMQVLGQKRLKVRERAPNFRR